MCCKQHTPREIHRRNLACDIANHGGLEEFHQKRHNYAMYEYHKARRLSLQREYVQKYASEARTSPE